MALRIGEYVVAGAIRNSDKNKVRGWLAFDEDTAVHFDVHGNLLGELAGKNWSFEIPLVADGGTPMPVDLPQLQQPQIGVAGTMELRKVRVPCAPIVEFNEHARLGEPLATTEHVALYLEWYSQDGRVVAEILDPVIEEIVDEPRGTHDVDVAPLTDIGPALSDDPFNLFPASLDADLANSNRGDELQPFADDDGKCRASTMPTKAFGKSFPGTK